MNHMVLFTINSVIFILNLFDEYMKIIYGGLKNGKVK